MDESAENVRRMLDAIANLDTDELTQLSKIVATHNNNRPASLEPLAYVNANKARKADAATELSRAEQKLSTALGSYVSERYSDLIEEVDAVRNLEAKLLTSHDNVETLAASMRRIRSSCLAPYETLKLKIAELEDVHRCAAMLRRVQRLLYLCRRLHEATALKRDDAAVREPSDVRVIELPKAALAVHEIEAILGEGDYGDVDVVRAELPFVRAAATAVRMSADEMLRIGVAEQNQAQIGTALQSFFNLRVLRQKALASVASVCDELRTTVVRALELRDAPIGRERRGAALWAAVTRCADALGHATVRIDTLARVLRKKRDPLSHTYFSAVVVAVAPVREPEEAPAASLPADTPALASTTTLAWPAADAAALATHPLFGPSGGASGGGAATPRPPRAEAPPVDAPRARQSSGGELSAVLFEPLVMALCEPLVRIADDSFIKQALASELPRLVRVLAEEVENLERELVPMGLTAECAAALSATAISRRIEPLAQQYEMEQVRALESASEALVVALERVGTNVSENGGAAEAAAVQEAGRLIVQLVVAELRHSASVPPLQLRAAHAVSQALSMLAARLEMLVSARVQVVVESPEWAAASAVNSAVFTVVRSLRALLSAELADVAEQAELTVRAALGAFSGLCLTLANPATPLQEELRADANALLRQVLRREMIDAE